MYYTQIECEKVFKCLTFNSTVYLIVCVLFKTIIIVKKHEFKL